MSDDKVVYLDIETKLDLPPDRILEGAKESLESVIIIGRTEEGDLYLSSSKADIYEVNYMLDTAKFFLMKEYNKYI